MLGEAEGKQKKQEILQLLERPIIVEFHYSSMDKKEMTLKTAATKTSDVLLSWGTKCGQDQKTLQAFNDIEFSGSPHCH